MSATLAELPFWVNQQSNRRLMGQRSLHRYHLHAQDWLHPNHLTQIICAQPMWPCRNQICKVSLNRFSPGRVFFKLSTSGLHSLQSFLKATDTYSLPDYHISLHLFHKTLHPHHIKRFSQDQISINVPFHMEEEIKMPANP